MRTLICYALLALVLASSTFVTGCAALSKGARHAGEQILDCGAGELGNLGPVAAALVPQVIADGIEPVEKAAIAAGARVGGCLLKHIHDRLPRPAGFVGVPTQAELAIANLRRATSSSYSYKTDKGKL